MTAKKTKVINHTVVLESDGSVSATFANRDEAFEYAVVYGGKIIGAKIKIEMESDDE